MKTFFILIMFVSFSFFETTNLFAFSDVGTHPDITKVAVKQSQIGCDNCKYLQDNLGFKNGLEEIILTGSSIRQILTDGAQSEDTGVLPAQPDKMCDRGLNHFYDPVNNKGLDQQCTIATLLCNPLIAAMPEIVLLGDEILKDLLHFQGYANPDWAIDKYDDTMDIVHEPNDGQQLDSKTNFYSWNRARAAFKAAMGTDIVSDRNRLFARMFRSIGQVTHLLQDMAVPAHVRNDMQGHLHWQKIFRQKFGFNLKNHVYNIPGWMGNNFEAYVFGHASSLGLIHGNHIIPTLGDGDTVRAFWDSGKYDGNNLSFNTVGLGLAEYTAPNFLSQNKMLDTYIHPSINDVSVVTEDITAEDGKTDKRYYFRMRKGACVPHLASTSVLNRFGVYIKYLDGLDETCFKDYATHLVPKAVDYSTALINYFFRGQLNVTEAVVVDGDTSGIKKITAKVVNKTLNNEEAEETPNGEVYAFARYKTGPEAQDYSYAVSDPATDADENIVSKIDSNTPADMTFTFPENSLPSNAQDISLHVFYYGDLGNEKETGIAIGMDEVKKLYVLLESGNYNSLFSVLTNSVVTDLRNPRYDMVDEVTKKKLYPDAKEFFEFPEVGYASVQTDFGFYRESYLKIQNPCANILQSAPDPKHDNNQEKLPKPSCQSQPTGTECPGVIPEGGTFDKKCAGNATVTCKDRLEEISYFDKIAEPKNRNDSYVSNYVISESVSRSSWNNTYNGLYDIFLDPASCDTYEDLNKRCACWIEAYEHRPYASTQTIDKKLDEESTGWQNVKRITPLGILYSIPSYIVYESELNYTSHSKTGAWYITSGSCGWNDYGYYLGWVYPPTIDIIEESSTGDANESTTYVFQWVGDRNNFSETKVHCASNTLLNYYVSFPVLKDMVASDNQGKDIFVDQGYYVQAQLLRKEGLYDPKIKKFDADYNLFKTSNPNFEDAIKEIIAKNIAQTPTSKSFYAKFCIAGDKVQ